MKKTISLFLCMHLITCICLAAEVENWKEYKTAHFIIYYKNITEDFLKTVENAAENYYDEIAQNLGFVRYKSWTYEERGKIYIYNDAADYTASARQADWSHGAALIHDKTIRTFPSANGFFDSTLPHELGHIIFREFIGEQAEIPLWLEEGVAMYQEKAKRWGANKAVQSAIQNGQFISLTNLSRMRLYNQSDTPTVELFYAESASIVYYLISEQGQERFVAFCRKLKERHLFEQALKETYVRFNNLDDLNKAWLNYLK